MTILVTGGGGFIGSFVVEELVSRAYDVVVPTRDSRNRWRATENDRLLRVEGNLSETRFQKRLFREYHPEVLIHCAWMGVGRGHRDDPIQEANLSLTGNLLDLCVENEVSLFIGLGSQAEYGIHNCRIDEIAVTSPETAYGRFKLRAGRSGLELAEKAGIDYAWLRLFSAFGPRDSNECLIPYVIRSLLGGVSPELTTCRQRWDYLYVKDVAKLIAEIVDKEQPFRGIYNLCSGVPRELRDLVLTVKDILGTQLEPRFGAIPQRKDGLFHLEGDNGKFKETFGWIEMTDINEALAETIEWFRGSFSMGEREPTSRGT